MTAATSTKKLVWSSFQEAVFKDVATGEGDTGIRARAGSAKSTTLLESLNYVPSSASVLLTSFATAITDELKERAPFGVEVAGLNSYGFRTVRANLGQHIKVDKTRIFKTIEEVAPGRTYAERKILAKAASMAKVTLSNTAEEITRCLDRFAIDQGERRDVVETVQAILERSKVVNGFVDFDDQIWLPIALDLYGETFDRVMCDEEQDFSPAQLELVLRATNADGRITFVGDDRQSCYSWRGAAEDAFDTTATRLGAKILPLPVCYRCAKSVIQEAQLVVPDIQAAPDAIDGLVADVSKTFMLKNAGPGDFILSRINAPLVGLCFALLAQNRSAVIQGRDIGRSLKDFVERGESKVGPDLKALLDWVDQVTDREVEKLRSKDPESNVDLLVDRRACLHVLGEHVDNLDGLKLRLETLFSDEDNRNRIVLSSVHRAKGLERKRVFKLENTFRPGRSTEEDNLVYIATTRAREQLYRVNMPRGDVDGFDA